MSYGPGLYAVRLHALGDNFGRGLALARRHGDYDQAERAWYITVPLPDSVTPAALGELAELGAVITRHGQEEP